MNSNFSILLQKEVCEFLNGDIEFHILNDKQIKMPYLSTSKLIELLRQFGFTGVKTGESRWQYMEQLLQHTNKHEKTSALFVLLFDLNRFKGVIPSEYTSDEVLQFHRDLVDLALNKINGYLVYSNKELRKDSSHFYLVDKKNTTIVASTQLRNIDMDYIHSLTSRIQSELDSGNFDEVLTKCRTLTEEIFIYILEKNNESNIPKENFVSLIAKIQTILDLRKRTEFDERVNAMLSGLNKVIQSVIELRNKYGDAHGQGSKRISIGKSETMLAVNATITYLDYIYSVYLEQKNGA